MSVREGLLALLAQGPRHGYQLKGELERALVTGRPVNVGQVYSTLDRLVRDGLVTESASDGAAEGGTVPRAGPERRRRFEITDAGRAALSAWFAATPIGDDATGRTPDVARVLLAVATGTADPLAVVRAQRGPVVARLQAVRQVQRAATDLHDALAADADAARLEATLAWLDRTEERLRTKRSR